MLRNLHFQWHRHTGAPFGVAWLGKAYFLCSIGACFYVCRWFSWFSPELVVVPAADASSFPTETHSTSWTLMMYNLKSIGLIFLFWSSPNVEIAWLLVIIGVFQNQISFYVSSCYMSYVAMNQTPTYKYMGKKVRAS